VTTLFALDKYKEFSATVVERDYTSGLKSDCTERPRPAEPFRATTKIYDLGSEEYMLREPLYVIYEYLQGEVLAVVPELELYGEGLVETEALIDLKNEIIDLFEDLDSTPDNELGDIPKVWKRILNRIIEKV